MPIDFSRIAADWLAAWRAQQRQVGRALALLGPWLAERLQRLQTLEQRSRAWPVYEFEGRALSVRLVGTQIGIVQPYGSTGAAVAAPFVAFGRGFVRVGQAVEDEWVLPGLLEAVAGIVTAIDKSIDRWMVPRPELFDPRHARASDIFGAAALAWRGVMSSLPWLRRTATELRAALKPWVTSSVSAAGGLSAEAPGEDAAPGGSTGSSLERWLVGAILVIPLIPSWIERLARAAWIHARDKALDLFQSIEAGVFELRAKVLRKIVVELPLAMREVPALAAVLGAMVAWNIRYFARLAQVWFELVSFALDLLLRVVTWVVNLVIDLLNTIDRLIRGILHFDLLLFIKPLLGPAGTVIDLMGVRFTLDDLIEAGTDAVNLTIYATLKGAIVAARAAILAAGTQVPLVGRGIITSAEQALLLNKLSLIEQVIDALFKDTGGPMTETAAPVLTTKFPNAYDTLIGRSPKDVADDFRSFGHTLADNTRAVFDEISATLQRLAVVFDRTAADLARTGPAASMGNFGSETSGLVGDLYDEQIRGLGQRIAERAPNSFERWLVQGGFHIIGAVIPLYVQSMLRWWRQQAESGDAPAARLNPTSPHILARRAQLAHVHLPRLTLRAEGRPHDESLVRELAQQFQGAVQEAYREGQRRLAALQAVPV